MVNKRLYRKFNILTKYLMFFVSLVYFTTMLVALTDGDVKYLLLLIKVPAWIVAYGVLLSKVFGYCLAHRLPMYYMLSCNLLYVVRSHTNADSSVYIWILCVVFVVYLVSLYLVNRKCR